MYQTYASHFKARINDALKDELAALEARDSDIVPSAIPGCISWAIEQEDKLERPESDIEGEAIMPMPENIWLFLSIDVFDDEGLPEKVFRIKRILTALAKKECPELEGQAIEGSDLFQQKARMLSAVLVRQFKWLISEKDKSRFLLVLKLVAGFMSNDFFLCSKARTIAELPCISSLLEDCLTSDEFDGFQAGSGQQPTISAYNRAVVRVVEALMDNGDIKTVPSQNEEKTPTALAQMGLEETCRKKIEELIHFSDRQGEGGQLIFFHNTGFCFLMASLYEAYPDKQEQIDLKKVHVITTMATVQNYLHEKLFPDSEIRPDQRGLCLCSVCQSVWRLDLTQDNNEISYEMGKVGVNIKRLPNDNGLQLLEVNHCTKPSAQSKNYKLEQTVVFSVQDGYQGRVSKKVFDVGTVYFFIRNITLK